MPDNVYLDYNGELIDEGHLLTIQYGSKWVTYLLGAAVKLTDRRIWNPDDDVDLAVEQATELIVRLMGMEELAVQKVAMLPMYINPLGMRFVSPETSTFYSPTAPTLFSNGAHSLSTSIERDWAYFDVFLTAGSYALWFFMPKRNDRGKVQVTCDVDVDLSGTIFDLYNAVMDNNNQFTQTVNIPFDGVFRFTLRKHPKNPASSNGYVGIHAVLVVEL